MNLLCTIFGHRFNLQSVLGNFYFCDRCGTKLSVNDDHILRPGERKYGKDGVLYEKTEAGLVPAVDLDQFDQEPGLESLHE